MSERRWCEAEAYRNSGGWQEKREKKRGRRGDGGEMGERWISASRPVIAACLPFVQKKW